jgi:uridine kinase
VLGQDLRHLDMDERSKVNFDHPDSLETNLFIKHIQDLKKGMDIEVPKYCFATHTRKEETIRETSKPIIILEGILILTDEALRKELDVSVYVVRKHEKRGGEVKPKTHWTIDSQIRIDSQTIMLMYVCIYIYISMYILFLGCRL